MRLKFFCLLRILCLYVIGTEGFFFLATIQGRASFPVWFARDNDGFLRTFVHERRRKDVTTRNMTDDEMVALRKV